MSRTLQWDDEYCPNGHKWIFIPSSTLYSDLYLCKECDCFYQPTVKRLAKERIAQQYTSDRVGQLIERAEFLEWKNNLKYKDWKELSNDKAE